jgi:hypothetical protein
MYKDKNSGDFQGRLVAGPMWDFNLSYGNADYCEAFETTGWQYNFDQICNFTTQIPFWWKRLLDAPSYRNGLRCRWNELREGPLHTDSLHQWIDSMANYLQEARIRNFQKWPIIGQYVNWNAFVGNTYQEDLDFMKDYISQRAAWLDTNIPGICNVGISETTMEPFFKCFPNPAQEWLSIESVDKGTIFKIMDAEGKFLKVIDASSPIWIGELSAGLYLLQGISSNGQQQTLRFVKY